VFQPRFGQHPGGDAQQRSDHQAEFVWHFIGQHTSHPGDDGTHQHGTGDNQRNDDADEGDHHRKVQPQPFQILKLLPGDNADGSADIPVKIHEHRRAEVVPVFVQRLAAALVVTNHDGVGLIRQPEAERQQPSVRQVLEVWGKRCAVEGVAQVHDERCQDDDANCCPLFD